MNQWFGTDGHLQNTFVRVLDMAVLNLCFVISCIPLVTIGTALTALHSVNFKILRQEEGRVSANYWQAFRDNFGQSTKLWLILLAVGILFAMDFWALSQLEGSIAWILKTLLGGLLVVYLAMLHYVFAYTARFSDTLMVSLKNTLMICGANLLPTVSLLCITFLAVFVSLYSFEIFLRAIYIWLVLGFAALNCLQSFLLNRVFSRYV